MTTETRVDGFTRILDGAVILEVCPHRWRGADVEQACAALRAAWLSNQYITAIEVTGAGIVRVTYAIPRDEALNLAGMAAELFRAVNDAVS